MSAWTWLLVGLCAAGALLALISIIRVALLANRVSTRINELSRSRLFISLQSLSIQGDRLSRLPSALSPLQERVENAVASIPQSLRTLQLAEARRTLAATGAQLRALFIELQ